MSKKSYFDWKARERKEKLGRRFEKSDIAQDKNTIKMLRKEISTLRVENSELRESKKVKSKKSKEERPKAVREIKQSRNRNGISLDDIVAQEQKIIKLLRRGKLRAQSRKSYPVIIFAVKN